VQEAKYRKNNVVSEEQEQSLKLAPRQPWVWSVTDFAFSIWGWMVSPLTHHLILPPTVFSQCTQC